MAMAVVVIVFVRLVAVRGPVVMLVGMLLVVVVLVLAVVLLRFRYSLLGVALLH